MKRSHATLPAANQPFVWIAKEVPLNSSSIRSSDSRSSDSSDRTQPKVPFAPLQPVRQHLDRLTIQTPKLAHLICQVIPARCPFERTIRLGNRTLLHIPPLCKLNPLYEQFVGLRFRALCYLADECGEDIARYC